MARVFDAVVGAVVGELLRAVLEMKDKAVKFKPTLERMESTLKSIGPLINQIEELNKKLHRPAEETEELINHMKSGKELVLECSNKVQWWNCCYKAHYQKELEALDESIRRFFELDMCAQDTRNGLETRLEIRDFRAEFRTAVPLLRSERIELRGVCSPPEPPPFTVGLDVPLNELKRRLLRDEVSVSVRTVTGYGGSGKSTLAKTLCWDDQVKGKFKENIFFVTFAKTPKLNTIVQKLFQHTGYQVPEFQGDEDAINQLEYLLKQIGKKGPILLVLDDVWLGSASLVDNFVFQIPNCKILVTSRFAIRRFGPPYALKPLAEPDAINLLQHSASINQRSADDIPHDVVKEIARGCCGSPLALRVIGRSLSHQPLVVWHNRARDLLKGRSILDSSTDVLSCLEKSLDVLDPKAIECFRDLGLFPEHQRIPATALVDMWAELHNEDYASAMEKINELADLNMADIIVTRKVAMDTDLYYNNHFLTQHDLLRELAIHQSSQEPFEQRKRLIIDLSGSDRPEWCMDQKQKQVVARKLSISTDETFTSDWCNMQPDEAEVLVLNIRSSTYTLPVFTDKMSKLKVLIVTNYGFHPSELDKFELLSCLPYLKSIRLEKVSIPLLCKLKGLQKLSIYMCKTGQAFESSSIQISDALPNLVELNIDYCNDLVELPSDICKITTLKKLRITNCHKLSALPQEIGKLENLEVLRLSSCSDLLEIPESATTLHKLRFLDISDCVNLTQIPENIGDLLSLEKLYMWGCSKLSKLPHSVTNFKLLKHVMYVICDEEVAALWENFSVLPNLKIKISKADILA